MGTEQSGQQPHLQLSLPDWVRKTVITKQEWQLYWIWENGRTRHEYSTEEKFENPYLHYCDTIHWKKFRAEILLYAQNHCADCDEQAADVYHLTYANLGNETVYDVLPLCEKCRIKRDGGGPLAADLVKILQALQQVEKVV